MFQVCNQNESNMYVIWFIRDLPIGLHTALCSTSDLSFPRSKVYCLSTGVYKCSLLLTSYFSKTVAGEKKKKWPNNSTRNGLSVGVSLCLKWVYRTSLLLLIRMSNCFFFKSPSAEQQVLLLSFLSLAKVWNVDVCALSSTLHIIHSVQHCLYY